MKRNFLLYILILGIIFGYGVLVGKKEIFPYNLIRDIKSDIKWDSKKKMADGFKLVDIPSSLDNSKQKAYIFTATNKNRPLIVSLHTWSGDYSQDDPLAEFAKSQNINYIHPNFRGPNWTTDACCSNKVIKDIDDAIQYMINTDKIDLSNITIVGTSGGAYTALCYYFKTKHQIKQFLSWAPLSDLEDWYIDSKIRESHYANDIYSCTNSKDNILNINEAQKRSPLYYPLNKNTFRNSKLYIFAGIHDGYTGSIPITHSINMYNKILERDNAPSPYFVSRKDTKFMLANRSSKWIKDINMKIEDRDVYFYKKYKNISLTIFDGEHENLVEHSKKMILNKEN